MGHTGAANSRQQEGARMGVGRVKMERVEGIKRWRIKD